MIKQGHSKPSLKHRVLIAGLMTGYGMSALAQAQDVITTPNGAPTPRITLSLPKEVEISVLLDLASQHLGINLIYDQAIRSKRISVLAQDSVTPAELQELLETALAIQDLVIVPTKVEGWFRVAASSEFIELSGQITGHTMPGDYPSTRVFQLQHVEPNTVTGIIEPYLSKPGGTSTLIPNTSALLVTDLPSSLQRVEQLISLIDQPQPERIQVFYEPKNTDAQQLSTLVSQVFKPTQTSTGTNQLPHQLFADARGNRLVISGLQRDVDAIIDLAKTFDTPDTLNTRRFTLANTSPDRLEKLIKALHPQQGGASLYHSSIDQEGNALIVRGNPELLDDIETLRQQIDQPVDQVRRPIRFYKIRNTTAANILATIQTITPDNDVAQIAISGGNATNPPDNAGLFGGEPEEPSTRSIAGIQSSVSGVEVTVGVDEDTNSIIVVGPPSAQAVYAELIERLDIRPPQVLIEVMLVTIDTSNGFELGVDISRQTDTGDTGKLLTFSSFGLSSVDAATGFLTPTLGLGFNGALLESDIADVVIRALKSDGRTRVEAAPSILINDGKVGTLTATSDQPTTSTSQGNTTDTTSFAGFVSAGTTVNITPRIAEGDHLALEYQVELSAFDGEGASGIPAPRQTNNISSDVTIPDGSTIVLGGLNRHDLQETVSRIPLLGEIPVLEYLFSSRKTEERDSTLFVFIKAQIMRDNDFRDLKTVSSMKRDEAEIPNDFPASDPLLMN